MRERDAKIITPRGREAAFVSIRTTIYICTVSRQSRHLDTAYITHHSGVHLVGLCSSYILTRGDSYMVPRRRSRDHEKASPNLYHSTNNIHTPYEWHNYLINVKFHDIHVVSITTNMYQNHMTYVKTMVWPALIIGFYCTQRYDSSSFHTMMIQAGVFRERGSIWNHILDIRRTSSSLNIASSVCACVRTWWASWRYL